MLNSFSTLGTWANLSIDVAEVDKSFEEFLTESQLIKILTETTPAHAFALLSKPFKSKAAGLDIISANLLRECPELLAESSIHIFNQSLMTGIFPDEWKTWKSARVSPLLRILG